MLPMNQVGDFSDMDDFDNLPTTDDKAKQYWDAAVRAESNPLSIKDQKRHQQYEREQKKVNDREREPCPRCNGTRVYNGYSSMGRQCFACKGTGLGRLATPAAIKAREKAAEKKEAKGASIRAQAQDWKNANPDLYAYIVAGANRGNEFMFSISEKLDKYGSLTEGQENAVRKGFEASQIRKQEATKETQARAVEAAPQALQALENAFTSAVRTGLKRPRLTVGTYTIKPAGATSRNPGALYVTSQGNYLGKVQNGQYLPMREATATDLEALKEILIDPMAAAIAHGRKTGCCAICSRRLTDPESVTRGIGPICAENMGW